MIWHYAARKKTYDYNGGFSETLFEVVEVYRDVDGKDIHTVDPVSVCSNESKQDLADWLRKAADDIEKYDLIDETQNE